MDKLLNKIKIENEFNRFMILKSEKFKKKCIFKYGKI